MNVFVIGHPKGIYRTQNLFKLLLDMNANVYFNSLSINSKINGRSFGKTIIRRISGYAEKILSIPYRFYNYILADIVIIPAMVLPDTFDLFCIRLLKKRLVMDFYISKFDTFVHDRKKLNEESIKAQKFKRIERYLVLNSRKIIFLNNVEKRYYCELLGINSLLTNASIIPLCNEPRQPSKMPFFSKESSVFSICWWGTYIPLHGLEKIINAAHILKKGKFKFKMYLLGDSEKKAEPFTFAISQAQLDDEIKVISNYSFRNGQLEDFLIDNCDIALGNFGDSQKAKHVLVNKVLDAISMKIPVLTGESLATSEFFDCKNDVWQCKNTAEDLADAIIGISKLHKAEILRHVEHAYKIYETSFSVKAYNVKMMKLFIEVLNEK